MASRTRSSSSSRRMIDSRKGQFFILTAVAIVTTLFFIGRWTGPLTQIDTSSIAQLEELSTFDNIKEKLSTVVKNSESCDDLNYNIQEYKNFIDDFAREKNYKILFDYAITPCDEELGGAITEVKIRIISEKVDASGAFDVIWP